MDEYFGLPFVTVPNERMDNMTIGEVIEELIYTKKEKEIYYPYDKAINNACNILERLPRNQTVEEWLKNNNNKY